MKSDLELLLERAREAGEDIGDDLLGALADAMEAGAAGDQSWLSLCTALRERWHNWEDESYHGSPQWVCQHCRRDDRRSGGGVCPQAHKWLKKVQVKVAEEIKELRIICDAERRAAHLKEKYGLQ